MSDENKPNWNDAPEWGNYLAQDKNGTWWWFRSKPISKEEAWHTLDRAKQADCSLEDSVWKSSLQARPKTVVSINWDSVPEHLNYFAIDEDGAGFFFHEKPVWDEEFESWQRAETDEIDWTNISEIIQADKMLLKRPK